MLQIENLNECQDLDREASQALTGGYLDVGALIASYSSTTNVFSMTQNAINVAIGAGDGGVIALGPVNMTPVSAGSPMTWVQS